MTRLLSPDGFARARHFLKTEARPLDRALFEFRFEGAPAEAVVQELAAYQNADGGFGHALEPDMWAPDSSALATAIGLNVLREIGAAADHTLTRPAIGYLLETIEPDTQVWRIVPPAANDHPHAPWWHDENGSLARTFGGFQINPRAQLVSLLYHFSTTAGAAIPAGWLDSLTERTVMAVETADRLDNEDLGPALELAGPGVPARYSQRVLARLRRDVPQAVSHDPAQWHTYSLRPLKIVHTPDSPVADLLRDVIQLDLDYQIDRQSPEGTWDPEWSWFGSYPDEWERARDLWRGHLMLETLTTLRAFGRIPNS